MAPLIGKVKHKLQVLSTYDWIFGFVLLSVSFLSFYKLGSMIFNNDAHFWYERTFNFIEALKKFDFAGTYQNPKPGITIMWLSGLSTEAFFTLYKGIFGFRPHLYTTDTFSYIHFAARAPLVLLNLGFLVFFYMKVKKLFCEKTALFASILLGFQPFFIATSRIFHADSTLTVFMGISALLLVDYLVNRQKDSRLILSGIFGGLAVLTKLSGVFLLPYSALLLIIYARVYKKAVPLYIKRLSIWIGSMLATFFVLFPAMWVKPLVTLNRLYLEAFTLTGSGRDGISPFHHYLEIFPDFITPVLLVLVLVSIFCLSIRRHEGGKARLAENFLVQAVVVFIFFYLLQMSVVSQKMPRYLVPLFPFLSIIAGFGLSRLFKIASKRIHIWLILVFLVINLLPIISYFPHYAFYVNEPGRDSFDCSLCSEVGSYINNMEDTPEFNVLIDSINPQRFRPFIKGTVISQEELNAFESYEYVIMDSQGSEDSYINCSTLKEFTFKSLTYWEVLECNNSDL